MFDRSFFVKTLLFGCLAGGAGFVASSPALAYDGNSGSDVHRINWSQLNLSQDQSSTMRQLDSEWQQMYSDIYPQLSRDKARLRQMLHSPNANESDIMALESRIHENEERLRQGATRIFLNKRKHLSPQQQQSLRRMMN
jgi:Spy/CpxP family protein refolding chaperone